MQAGDEKSAIQRKTLALFQQIEPGQLGEPGFPDCGIRIRLGKNASVVVECVNRLGGMAYSRVTIAMFFMTCPFRQD